MSLLDQVLFLMGLMRKFQQAPLSERQNLPSRGIIFVHFVSVRYLDIVSLLTLLTTAIAHLVTTNLVYRSFYNTEFHF